MRPEKPLEDLITAGDDPAKFRRKLRSYTPDSAHADTWATSLISMAITRDRPYFIGIIAKHRNFTFSADCLTLVFEALNQNKLNCLSAILTAHNPATLPIDQRTEEGQTALRLAVEKNHADAVLLLLKHGANPHDICDQDAHSPLSSLIKSSISSDQKEQLIVAMMNVSEYTMETDVAFLTAVATQQPNLLAKLLVPKTDPALLSNALLLAKQQGFNDAVTLLENHGAMCDLPSIDPEDLMITSQFTNGGMSEISHAYFAGKDVVIKSVSDQIDGEREATVLLKAQHPHVIALHGVVNRGPRADYQIVMEYMENGDLEEYLRENPRNNDETRVTVQQWMHDIARALIFLHACGIIHCDIKCNNILINAQLRAKLCDFGFSTIATENETPPSTRGWSASSAPEIFNPEAAITSAADIYSFAVVLCVCASEYASAPYAHEKAMFTHIPSLIMSGPMPVIIPNTTPAALMTLLHDCMEKNPTLRPTAPVMAERLKMAFQK